VPKRRWLATFTQAGAVQPEVCKTVGSAYVSAYVGSNPTPATTSENDSLSAETRSAGPFPSLRLVEALAEILVPAWSRRREALALLRSLTPVNDPPG